ncbi:MAG: MFS transporter [Pseudomonadota bacterium]|nr:MFS transporter [Pseudomonadota bacterium]
MKPIIVVFLTVVLDLVGFGIVIPLLPFYAESFHATPLQVTLLMACYSLAQFVAAPLWGRLSDRVGRRPVMLASIGLTALMLAGFAASNSLWMLFVFRTLHGAMTANISTAQACMADLTTPENRAKGMGLIGAAFGIGFTLGPFLGGELAETSLTLPLWLAAGLSTLNLLLAMRWLPETRHAGSAPIRRSIAPAALWGALTAPAIGLCIALTFVQVFSFALMESTFTLFAERAHGMRPAEIGRLFGLVGIIGVVVQGGLIGRLVKRFGERPLVPVGLGLLTIGILALPSAPPTLALAIVFSILAVGQGLATPSLQSLISRSAAASDQGSVLGTAQSISALARATGPALGGVLFSSAGPAAPFYVAGLLLGCSVFLAFPATARAVSPLTPR